MIDNTINFELLEDWAINYLGQKHKSENLENKTKGQKVKSEFKKLGEKVVQDFPEFLLAKCTDWQNSGYIYQYLWMQFKHKEYKDNPSSISIFIVKDTNKNAAKLLIETEIDEKNAKKSDYEAFSRALDKSTSFDNSWYWEDNNETIFDTAMVAINSLHERTSKKVKIVKHIKGPYSNTESKRIINELKAAFKQLIPCYKNIYKYNEQIQEYNIDNKSLKFEQPKNQILYGPPGTGKTYNTVIKAMSIIDEIEYKNITDKKYSELKIRFDKLKQQDQIEFVTFHQSYSYEEFVEGIKPDIESGELKYKLEDGIFKNICEKASTLIIEDANNNTGLNSNPKIWKVSLMKTGENGIRKDCMKNNRIRIGFDKYGEDISDETVFDDGGSRVLSAFINKMEIGDIVLSCYSEKTIDAIGVITSEYKWDDNLPKYKRYRDVKWLVKGLNYNILEINSGAKFTLGTVYQLNNISIKDVLDIVNQNNGKQSYKTNDQPHILIIDEINRGNVSKIFGELITLIEEDKRIGKDHQMTVTLPYSKKTFGVPNNLYIIGTMNTADRSIALLDTALRRRFDFEEIMPKPELLNGKNIEGIDLEQLLTKINDRIKKEYDRDHQIGHSYLMRVENKEQLERAYKNRILPLLNEYFYNDIDSVAKILNCKPDEISSKENWFNVLKEAQKSTKKEND
ncbi:MAG TPA: AAA family ATPase [Candidatus Stercorousia faecigallinarum]|nr:AAA family ATPase [Candidatus Stercorousia faecigallinarum]